MASAHGFQDLKVWQRARELVRVTYLITGKGRFGKDHALRDQL